MVVFAPCCLPGVCGLFYIFFFILCQKIYADCLGSIPGAARMPSVLAAHLA